MANEIVKVENVVMEMDKVCESFNPLSVSAMPRFQAALATADAIGQLRKWLTNDMVKVLILPLKDTALGFKTDERSRLDKNRPAYSLEQIRDVAIEAMLRGFALTGNEFNMIAGNFYGAKSGLARLVGQFPGVTDVVLVPEIAAVHQGGAVVGMRAYWKLNGQEQKMERVGKEAFAVRLNEGQGVDAAAGKAERKMYAAIYKFLTGSRHEMPNAELDDFADAESAQFSLPSPSSAGIPPPSGVIRPQAALTSPPVTPVTKPMEKPVTAQASAPVTPVTPVTPEASTPAGKPSATSQMKARIKKKAAESPKAAAPAQTASPSTPPAPPATPAPAAPAAPSTAPTPAAPATPPAVTPLGPPPANQAAEPEKPAADAKKDEYPPEREIAVQAVCALAGAADPANPSPEIIEKAKARWSSICKAAVPKKPSKAFTGADWTAVAEYANKLKAEEAKADPATGETKEEDPFDTEPEGGFDEPALPEGCDADEITMAQAVMKRTDTKTGAVKYVVRSLSQIDYQATDKQIDLLKKAQTAFEGKKKMRVVYHIDANDSSIYWIDDIVPLADAAEGATSVAAPVK